MKKNFLPWFVLGLMLFYGIAKAGRIMLSLIGPANSTSNVTIAAGGANNRNCLTMVDVTSDIQYNFRILDGGTTVYNVVVSSGSSLVRSWDDPHAFCGSANTAMYLNVSAGNPTINYAGFVGQ